MYFSNDLVPVTRQCFKMAPEDIAGPSMTKKWKYNQSLCGPTESEVTNILNVMRSVTMNYLKTVEVNTFPNLRVTVRQF